ncbi:MAG: hypothetical protein KF914_05580 [Rhizobiaceae bacterium]|nr:hypothetical protein [Rhizobiaceae bacterium]
MSLTGTFGTFSFGPEPVPTAPQPKRRKRDAPFAIRLSKEERARLEQEAAGAPLGTYIKAKALGLPPLRMRRSGLAVEDRQALAKALALLGRSRLSSNLNQLARLANVGALPMTPETEAELSGALSDVHDIRRLLMTALGLKPEAAR